RWVVIAMMGGRRAELDLAKLLAKRVQITGSTLRNRDDVFKAALMAEMREKVWPLFAEKKLSAQLERTFRADQAEEAFALLESNQVNGKIVLVLDDSLRSSVPPQSRLKRSCRDQQVLVGAAS